MSQLIRGRKFAVPALPAHHIERDVLLERLDSPAGRTARLIVVSAVAGAGKTTLLASLLARTHRLAGWITLGDTDTDPPVLFRNLEACLGGLVPSLPMVARVNREAVNHEAWEQAVGILCDDLAMVCDAPLLLILDQVERIQGHETSIRLLESLAGSLPDHVRLVLCGRKVPVAFARERLAGQVLDLGDADLAFTPHEVEALMAKLGQPADARQARAIVAATGGWAAGAAWMVVPRPTRNASGLLPGSGTDTPALDAYLVQEILAPLAPEARNILLCTSPLPVLDAARVGALTAASWDDVREGLASLGSFGRLGRDEIEWQPFFHDFLLRRLAAELPLQAQRHAWKTAAQLMMDEPEQAIRCLLRAEDPDAAEALLFTQLGNLLAEGRLETVNVLLDGFPADVRGKSPRWLHAKGECARESGKFVEACDLLEQAARACPTEDRELGLRIAAGLAAAHGARGRLEALKTCAWPAVEAQDPGSRGLARNALGLAALHEHQLEEALNHFEDALVDFRLAGRPSGEMRILHNRGLAHAKAGDLERALTAYGEAVRQAEAAGLAPFPLTYNNLALCHLHLGRHEEAWRSLERGLAVADRCGTGRDRMMLLRTRGQLLLADGDGRGAAEAFLASLDKAAELGDAGASALGHLGYAEAALALGRRPQARAALAQALDIVGQPLQAPSMTEAALVAARLALTEGVPEEAIGLCKGVLAHLDHTTNDLQRFKTLDLLATALASRGETTQAAQVRSEACDLALRHGYPAAGTPDISPAEVLEALPPTLALETLGVFEVRIEGAPLQVKEWRSSNAKLVLAYLLLHPQGATKERLHDLLYPGTEPARSALAMVISRLRQTLEPDAPKGSQSRFVHFLDGRYVVARGIRTRLDVNELRALLEQAGRPDLAPAERNRLRLEGLSHYRGPFLEEFPDHPWCQVEREGLRRLAVRAWEATFSEAGREGNWGEVERLASACLAADPTCQSALRAHLIALCMQERRQDALRSTVASLELLRAEQGLDPDEDTAELLALLEEERFTIRAAMDFLSRSD
ncbi:MAG: BTAD domain-containing putative transcriptional regulator [Candidatus Sericytochromatia bacterium]|nr:BTAD domain-containing putative transcriptional regulator [Candidatus Sericytochromatia bacterium]